jgi:hypothetical protein
MIELFILLDSPLQEFQRHASSPTMAIEIAVVLFCGGFGVALVLIAGSRGYFRRGSRPGTLASTAAINAPAMGWVEAVAPAASKPAPSPAPATYSNPSPTLQGRTQLGSRRYGGTYVRRTAPKRSIATKDATENKPN